MSGVIVSTPARVSLFGEYSNLIGEAITIALDDLRITCHISITNDDFHTYISDQESKKIIVKDIRKITNSWGDYITAAILTLVKHGYFVPYLSIHIKSNIPSKAGLSSSSALLVSIVHGISKLMKFDFSLRQIAEYAFLAESSELNIPCGRMDHYSCALGGIQHLSDMDDKSISVSKFIFPEQTRIIIAETQVLKNTKEIITKIFDAYNKKEKRIYNHIEVEKNLIRKANLIFKNEPLDLL